MSAKVIDLTEASSPSAPSYLLNENAIDNKSTSLRAAGSTRLPPLSLVPNNAQVPLPRPAPQHARQPLTKVLADVIDGMSMSALRTLVKKQCETNMALRRHLESNNLDLGKDVVRYHRDGESEDDVASEMESELESDFELEDSDKEDEIERPKKVYPIAVGDEEWTSRYAKCENCEERFDLSKNYRECSWHDGGKEVDYYSEFWVSHGLGRHPNLESFEDDPDYAGGFIWSCCEASVNGGEGCRNTKHKAAVNQVVHHLWGLKRKAEDNLALPVAKR